MLSVLIPVYNYDVRTLVRTIHNELVKGNILFEVCCLDDHSSPIITKNNESVRDLANVSYYVSEKNKGREQTRQRLSEQARYQHLLFLDADTMPVDEHFIKTYLDYLDTDYEAIFGGIAYKNEEPPQDQLLRWTYGRHNESQTAAERSKKPYQSITSPNFIIRKEVFQEINSKIIGNEYGYDVYFARLMREKKVSILHVDNRVYHLGLETSEDYLQKSEEALRTYMNLFRKGVIDSEDNGLMAAFSKLKSLKLHYILSGFYKMFGKTLKKNLLGRQPSIALFQLYRLSYLCHVDVLNQK